MAVPKSPVVLITNRECAADGIRCSGVSGEVLPRSDVLHEVPIYADRSLGARKLYRGAEASSTGWWRTSPATALGVSAATRRWSYSSSTTSTTERSTPAAPSVVIAISLL